ncbi:MAG: Abi family protein [Eubacteriales bacterium]|nr:Abi family protein [Eubacteriales bacterium]
MYQYPKNFSSVTQLIQKLIAAGMTIDSQDEAKMALTTIGYYRLKGYSFHRIDPATQKYIPGTNFSAVLKLYNFDSELSHLIFSYLSQIEVTLRARLVDAFQTTQDALILHDPSAFKDKQLYWRNQGSIASEISRSNDVFIEHNFNNHEGAIPLWASVEVMSFGTISKTIKNMKTGNQSAFSILVQNYKFKNANGKDVNPSKDMFTSWIQAVSIMRNICAHNSRIYNRAISTRPQLISSDAISPQPRYNGLYQIMLSMKYLRPTDESWTAFVTDFKQLLNKHAGAYDINKMNFPSDWESHF